MQMGKLRRALLVVPLLIILFIIYAISMQKKMSRIRQEVKEEMEITKGPQLQLALTDTTGKIKWFRIGKPQSVSRDVHFKKETRSPNAFHFPHGLTHLETSAHILSPDANPPTIKDIPLENLSGIVFLIDLCHLGEEPGRQIPWDTVQAKLEQNTLPISLLALKTHASLLPQDYDFSGKDFLSLAPETAKGIHDYTVSDSRIQCLILDLPSIDPEKDDGKLLAHRYFFGLPETGTTANDKEKRALVELAWFSDLNEGYYYATITPPQFETNAVTTGIVFRPLIERK